MKHVVTITIEVDMTVRDKNVGDHFEQEVSEALEKLYNRINWSRDTQRRSGKTRNGTVFSYQVDRGRSSLNSCEERA